MQVQWIHFFLHFSWVSFVVMLFNCSSCLIFTIHWYNSVAGRTGSYCKRCVSRSCKLNCGTWNMQQSINLPNRARLPDIFTAVHPKTGQCACGYCLPNTFKHVSVWRLRSEDNQDNGWRKRDNWFRQTDTSLLSRKLQQICQVTLSWPFAIKSHPNQRCSPGSVGQRTLCDTKTLTIHGIFRLVSS